MSKDVCISSCTLPWTCVTRYNELMQFDAKIFEGETLVCDFEDPYLKD